MLNSQVLEINQLCQQKAMAVVTLLHKDRTREFRNSIDGQIHELTSRISPWIICQRITSLMTLQKQWELVSIMVIILKFWRKLMYNFLENQGLCGLVNLVYSCAIWWQLRRWILCKIYIIYMLFHRSSSHVTHQVLASITFWKFIEWDI